MKAEHSADYLRLPLAADEASVLRMALDHRIGSTLDEGEVPRQDDLLLVEEIRDGQEYTLCGDADLMCGVYGALYDYAVATANDAGVPVNHDKIETDWTDRASQLASTSIKKIVKYARDHAGTLEQLGYMKWKQNVVYARLEWQARRLEPSRVPVILELEMAQRRCDFGMKAAEILQKLGEILLDDDTIAA